jgi:hypothetical protein
MLTTSMMTTAEERQQTSVRSYLAHGAAKGAPLDEHIRFTTSTDTSPS